MSINHNIDPDPTREVVEPPQPNDHAAVGGVCVDCGSTIESGWQFCRSCGRHLAIAVSPTTEVPVIPVDDIRPAPSLIGSVALEPHTAGPQPTPLAARRRRSRLAIAAIAAAVLAVFGAVGVLGWNDAGTHQRLHSTRAVLTSTRARLKETLQTLDTTKADLTRTTGELATRTAERNDLESKLTAAQTELTGVKGSLSDARGTITAQQSEIQDLDTCLKAIARSSVYASDGDYTSAIAVLNSVTSICNRAETNL